MCVCVCVSALLIDCAWQFKCSGYHRPGTDYHSASEFHPLFHLTYTEIQRVAPLSRLILIHHTVNIFAHYIQ